MSLEFSISKSGSKIFKYNSYNFHSNYSPEKEAERYVSLTNFEYNPEFIFIIEPGLNYSYKYFKIKYKNSKIGIIRIIKELDSDGWDFSIDFNNFSDSYLLDHFSYEKLLNSQIICWPVCDKLFPVEIQSIYANFTKALKQAKTLAITSQYFEKKWLLNSISFLKYLNNYIQLNINHSNFPILITASGPSLTYCIEQIKTVRNKVFLISLSSSLSFLIANTIKPDLILTTDGGFWAGQHLKQIKQCDCPIAIPPEAYIQKDFLHNKTILPLNYPDGISSDLLNLCEIPYFLVERNGTVSGTALKFAQKITDGPIYFAGLDLACCKEFQHSQPNELEKNNSFRYNHISNLEKKAAVSSFGNESLSIYRKWFENQKIKNPTYRIIHPGLQNSLGQIKDIRKEEFLQEFKYRENLDDLNIFSNPFLLSTEEKSKNCENLLNFINQNSSSDKFLKQLFPLDYISLNHCKTNEEKQIVLNRIHKNAEEIISKIRKLLDD